jgi:NADP-reducing hydrogenase subunit HndA
MDFSMLDAKKLQELDQFISGFEDKESHLIAILHKAQGLFGYLPLEVQEYVSQKTGVAAAKIYGVVTFYSFFTMQPRGKHTVSCCMGTACFVKGGERILDVVRDTLGVEIGQMTDDGMFMLEQVHCLGACSLAPVVSIDGKVYGHVTRDKVKEILDSYYVVEKETAK